jgi:hypothetical protein
LRPDAGGGEADTGTGGQKRIAQKIASAAPDLGDLFLAQKMFRRAADLTRLAIAARHPTLLAVPGSRWRQTY